MAAAYPLQEEVPHDSKKLLRDCYRNTKKKSLKVLS